MIIIIIIEAKGTRSIYLTHTAHGQARHTPKSHACAHGMQPTRRRGRACCPVCTFHYRSINEMAVIKI